MVKKVIIRTHYKQCSEEERNEILRRYSKIDSEILARNAYELAEKLIEEEENNGKQGIG